MHASRYQIVVSRRLGIAGREAFREFPFRAARYGHCAYRWPEPIRPGSRAWH